MDIINQSPWRSELLMWTRHLFICYNPWKRIPIRQCQLITLTQISMWLTRRMHCQCMLTQKTSHSPVSQMLFEYIGKIAATHSKWIRYEHWHVHSLCFLECTLHVEGTPPAPMTDIHVRPTYLLLPRTVSVFGMQYVSGKCIALITNTHIQNTKFNYYTLWWSM